MNGEEKERISDLKKRIIVVSKDGPYLIFGGLPLEKEIILNDEAGDDLEWCLKKVYPLRETYALCRCGKSRNKPYCDRTHLKIGFNGSETASREPYNEQAKVTDGPGICLSDVPSLCAASRFCHRAGGIGRLLPRSNDAKVKKIIIEEACNCASGRLVALDKKSKKPIEPVLDQTISIVEDPKKRISGPIRVKGGVRLESADGKLYETRNRVTLCRCGKSKNKPFCDATHVSIKFKAKEKERALTNINIAKVPFPSN
jgi:CDGSH-type Zn-finger protein